MMKRDLKVAREKWIKEVDNPEEQAERAKDFVQNNFPSVGS